MAPKGTDNKSGYHGPERRKYARRLAADRRKDVRWEPNNPNRRKTTGRRVIDHLGVLDTKR
jgi:hypothetical protein